MSSDPLDISDDLPLSQDKASASPPNAAARSADQSSDAGQSGPAQIRPEAWSARHTIDLRISIPFGFGRYYVTIVAGPERRSRARRTAERRLHPLATFGNIALCAGCGILVGLAGLALIQFALAYVLQQTGSLVIIQ